MFSRAKVGPKIVVSAGFLVAAAGMALLTRIELDRTYATHTMPGMILMGLGIGADSRPELYRRVQTVPQPPSAEAIYGAVSSRS